MNKGIKWKTKDGDPPDLKVKAKAEVFEAYRDRQIRTEQDRALVR